MLRTRLLVTAAAAAALFPLAYLRADTDSPAARFWPQWRGPHATGVSRTADPPLKWSESRNVRWKLELPGRGASTPVIWGDHLFLSTAVPIEGTGPRARHRYVVMAVDRKDG